MPSYLPYTKLFLEERENFAEKFKEIIEKGYTILTSGNDLQILDFVSIFLMITHNDDYHESIIGSFDNNSFLEYYRCAKYIELVLKKYKGKNVMSILESIFFMHQSYQIKACKSMHFINDTYCFVHRTSTVANELVANPKLDVQPFAYFFEQDYNLILAKVSKVSAIITKKYEVALVKLYKKRKNFKRHFVNILPADFIAH